MGHQEQEQTDPVQEKARQEFEKWKPHLHKLTPWKVAGILNDIECAYVGERHETFCRTLHFLAFEWYATENKKFEMKKALKEAKKKIDAMEVKESYDCVIHGTGPGPDCPRC